MASIATKKKKKKRGYKLSRCNNNSITLVGQLQQSVHPLGNRLNIPLRQRTIYVLQCHIAVRVRLHVGHGSRHRQITVALGRGLHKVPQGPREDPKVGS